MGVEDSACLRSFTRISSEAQKPSTLPWASGEKGGRSILERHGLGGWDKPADALLGG